MPSPLRLFRPLSDACTIIAIFLTAFVSQAKHASAAEIISSGTCEATLFGQIAKGDANRLQEVRDKVNCRDLRLQLSSPGGSVAEALAIADSLENVTTIIEKNQECLSACALIFMAARSCSGSPYTCAPTRRMHPSATLGFHAPFLQPSQSQELVPMDLSFSAALDIFAEIQRRFSRISAIVARTGYRQNMIHPDLFVNMFNTPPEEFYTITTNDQFHTFDIDLLDDIPGDRTPELSREQVEMLCYNFLYEVYRGWNHSEFGFQDYDYMRPDTFDSVAEHRTRGNDQYVRFDALNLGYHWSGWCKISAYPGMGKVDVGIFRGETMPSGEIRPDESAAVHYSMGHPLQTTVADLSWTGSATTEPLLELVSVAREYFIRLDRQGAGAPSALWVADKRPAIDRAAAGICAAEAPEILDQTISGATASIVLLARVTSCGNSDGEDYLLRMDFTGDEYGWKISALSTVDRSDL